MQTEALLGKHFGYIDELENCVNMQKDSDRWFIATRDRCPVHPYSRLNTMLAIFDFHGQSIRTAQDEQGNIWFCLKDILTSINTTTTTAQAQTLLEEGFGTLQVIVIPLSTPGGKQQAVFVSEAGTTFLISRSRTETGKKLNRWIHMEILPSIRKSGSYSLNNNATLDDDKILNQIDKVASVLNAHCGDEYRQKFTIDNLQNTYPHLSFPNQKKRKPRRNNEEVILSKIYSKAQVLGQITPRQVQQWFTNRHNKVTADNARAYLRKLCELGLGYLETDGTFVAHIDNEIMAQLAL